MGWVEACWLIHQRVVGHCGCQVEAYFEALQVVEYVEGVHHGWVDSVVVALVVERPQGVGDVC